MIRIVKPIRSPIRLIRIGANQIHVAKSSNRIAIKVVAVKAILNAELLPETKTFVLPITNVTELIVTAYEHRLELIRGVIIQRSDGKRPLFMPEVDTEKNVRIKLLRPTTGTLIIY